MARKSDNILTEGFLAELYNSAITNDYMCSVVTQYMQDAFLPSREYQTLNDALKKYFKDYKMAPKYGMIEQICATSRATSELLDEIHNLATDVEPASLRDQFEKYLKLVQFKKIYKEIGKKFDDGEGLEAIASFEREASILSAFSLAPDQFVDVAETFESRLRDNKERHLAEGKKRAVTRFYIDALDELNRGRNLRTQLSVILAMSGVGKSHYARWVGYNAAYVDGLNVLHFQLEGAASETLDAYSACMIGSSAFDYENGKVTTHSVEQFKKLLETYKGTLRVKAYPKFGKEISTIDIMNGCEEYHKELGYYPDVIIVDSLDLLNDSSGKSWDNRSLRFKRIAVAEDLKDLAGEIDAWVVATYQATIEDPEWVNDEKNVLNGYNLSEAKGLQRPCTHLVSLNQSRREMKEETMRLYVAKSRFFRSTGVIRICTDYDHECFYSRERTLNLPPE
jgi:hypothetical protein